MRYPYPWRAPLAALVILSGLTSAACTPRPAATPDARQVARSTPPATAPSTEASPARHAPSVRLSVGRLSALVYLPDARDGHYRGSRFDWSGMVGELKLDDRVVWNEWNPSPDATADHDNAVGPAMEFGMKSPLGFDAASPGETFLKIGVGALRRPSTQPYFFRHRYDLVDGGEWRVTSDARSVTFAQSVTAGAYGYAYEKRVALHDGDELTIACALRNTGAARIATDVYAHNFFRLDDAGWMPGTTAAFDRPVRMAPEARPRDTVRADAAMIHIVSPLPVDRAAFVPLMFDSRDAPRAATLTRGMLRVATSVDFAPSQWVLFGLSDAVCLEPFLPIALDPGQSVHWTYRYHAALRK